MKTKGFQINLQSCGHLRVEVPNLDFRLMHARCNVPPHEDLLHAVGQMKDEERRRAEEIIEAPGPRKWRGRGQSCPFE